LLLYKSEVALICLKKKPPTRGGLQIIKAYQTLYVLSNRAVSTSITPEIALLQEKVMRAVSLNCWGGRVPGLAEWLQSTGADVFCLQEMYNSPTSSALVAEDPADANNPPMSSRINLYQELQEALPEHESFLWPFARNFINDGTASTVPLYYGIATFVRKTFPVIWSRTEFVHGEFRFIEPTGEKNRLPLSRNAHVFRVLEPETTKVVSFAHMHGLWDPSGKQDTPARDGQRRLFGGLVDAASSYGKLPTVVCGDFNLLPESSFFVDFQGRGFSELVTSGGRARGTRTSFYTNNPKKKNLSPFADYALVNQGVRVKNFEIVRDPEVSDHCPLLIDFEI
jgi:endonuclease/exonuclease/phosphatase family metal-dependent hydrolase